MNKKVNKKIEYQMRYFTDKFGLAREELIVTIPKEILNKILKK